MNSPTSSLARLSFEDVSKRLQTPGASIRQSYRAMYSSWYDGIVTDPGLMMIPIDDHGFHRGDAVFEAIKCVGGKIFALDPHLERMKRSGDMISLKLPKTTEELKEIAIATIRAAGVQDCYLRYYVSRGPGGFTPNPYDSIGAQVYLVITDFKATPVSKYEQGVSVKMSAHRVKEGFFATVKSCNYLPNVMMKKEAVDAGVDFTISRDEHDWLAEGSTENFAIISKDGEFIVPGFERTLKGVTATRVMELASKCVSDKLITSVRNGHIKADDVFAAREAMMLGTTLDVLPVTKFEGRPIASGQVGPICRELQKLLLQDMSDGPFVTRLG